MRKRRAIAASLHFVVLGVATEAHADVKNPDEVFGVLTSVPGFLTAGYSIGMIAGIAGYYDDPGWLRLGNYFAGGFAMTSGIVYTVAGAAIEYDEVRAVYFPVGGVNLALGVTSFALAATSGKDNAVALPFTPVLRADGNAWQVGVIGRL